MVVNTNWALQNKHGDDDGTWSANDKFDHDSTDNKFINDYANRES